MNEETIQRVKELLESLRINLQADGGDLELKRIEGTTVYLKLVGACGTCPFAMQTLKGGIERILKEQISEEITVERED